MKILKINFFKSSSGQEPVRDRLNSLTKSDKYIIGEKMKTIEYGWPIGMPLVKKMDTNLWEVRCDLTAGRICRVFFTIFEGYMILLHGFIKKSQKTTQNDLDIAKKRRNLILNYRSKE